MHTVTVIIVLTHEQTETQTIDPIAWPHCWGNSNRQYLQSCTHGKAIV